MYRINTPECSSSTYVVHFDIVFCHFQICIVLTVIGLKNVTDTTEDFDDTYSHKKLLRISAVALPLFAVIWFTGMVSLENSASLLFSLIFLISDTVLVRIFTITLYTSNIFIYSRDSR